MIRFRRYLTVLIALLALTPGGAVKASAAAWHQLSGLVWSDSSGAVRTTSFDLADDIAMSWLPATDVRGHWVRVTGSALASAPDFKVWIHTFAKDRRSPLSRPMPTTKCVINGLRKLCSNEAWVAADAQEVRASFYASGTDVQVLPWRVEIADTASVDPRSTRRYNALIRKLQDIYFRSVDVDWPTARAAGLPALASPSGVDPLPQAGELLLEALPDHRHMSIILNNAPLSGTMIQMPRCEPLGGGRWKLVLPASTGQRLGDRRYVDISQRCLMYVSARRWIIDLTSDMGGNASTQLAALAPLLAPGLQLRYRNAAGKMFAVALTPHSVKLDSRDVARWPVRLQMVHAPTQFVIGPGCASACEAVALSAKGRFPLLGQPTAGLTSANEVISLNSDVSMLVTAGVMTDRAGTAPYPNGVRPDVLLNERATRALLMHGTY